MRTPVGGIELSVVEVVGQRLVEQEGTARSVVGDGLGIDGVEARRLVQDEVTLGWAASRREGRRSVGQALTPRNMRCAGAPIRGARGWRRGRAGR